MWIRAWIILVGALLCFAQALQKLEQQIALLPRVNYDLLSYICRWVDGGTQSIMGEEQKACVWCWFLIGRFLFEVQLKSTVNKMNVENLATVMGINLLKPQIEDPITVMKGEEQPCGHIFAPCGLKMHSYEFFFLVFCSDSSDPEADDRHDQSAPDLVSAIQRHASLSPVQQDREPEEHSTKLRWLGVCRGRRSSNPCRSWQMILPFAIYLFSVVWSA